MTEIRPAAQGGVSYLIEVIAPDGTVKDSETRHNLMPEESLNHCVNVVLKQTAQATGWYLAPFEGNYQPLATDKASTIAAASTETTAYSAASRVQFIGGVTSNGTVENSASRAEFGFTQAKTLFGAFMVSSSPKSGTTGVLLSIVRFASPKVVQVGDILRLTAGVSFTSV